MKSVLIIISILFFQLVSHGAPIVDVDNPENRIQRKTVHGVELIEVCLDGDCEVFPHEDAPLIGFRGTEQEWTDIFYTCSTYEDLNLFTTLTELVSAFLVRSFKRIWTCQRSESSYRSFNNSRYCYSGGKRF